MSPTPYSNPGYIAYLLASYELVGNIFNVDSVFIPHDLLFLYFDGNNTTGMGSLNSLLPMI